LSDSFGENVGWLEGTWDWYDADLLVFVELPDEALFGVQVLGAMKCPFVCDELAGGQVILRQHCGGLREFQFFEDLSKI